MKVSSPWEVWYQRVYFTVDAYIHEHLTHTYEYRSVSTSLTFFFGLYSRFCCLQNKDDFGVNTYIVKSVENAINCIFFIENMCIFQFYISIRA